MSAAYDVIVVGAGPAGATAAYYLAKGMPEGEGKRVALLDKARFPRDKFCGDAWCSPALDILDEMGVLAGLERDGVTRNVLSGGFVSPAGHSFISTGDSEQVPGTRVYAIKRKICDERIARRAAEVGANLIEEATVAEADLEADGLWRVRLKDGRQLRSRALVAADGAKSGIARRLGVVSTPAHGAASRQYIRAGTHNFKAHGVLFYPSYILPGYVALFRHANDDVDLGCYVLPGGRTQPGELKQLYETRLKADPFLQRALGPKAEPLEKVRIAPLRMGGERRSSGERLIVVGDAAGQTDPLTGEGIHTAMIAARIAARTLHECFARGDLTARATQAYHDGWQRAFGRDFAAAGAAAKLVQRFPMLLDVANVVGQRMGDAFMAEFGAAMTGVKSKTVFLRPDIAGPLGVELVRQASRRLLAPGGPSADEQYAARAREEAPRDTAFARAGLRQALA